MWAKLLNQTGKVAYPIFYQFVTNKIMAQLIKSLCIKSKEPSTDIVESRLILSDIQLAILYMP